VAHEQQASLHQRHLQQQQQQQHLQQQQQLLLAIALQASGSRLA
jgi:hypothetical protein